MKSYSYFKCLMFFGLSIFLLTSSCTNEKAEVQSEPEMILENQDDAESHRPVYHFTPREKWMNDPNGMVFYEGEYHLFYQYYPDDIVWGPMHWGHAVSKNMVDWEHLPIALFPDKLGYIFSGSAVVDWNNSSGFGKDGKPPLVAIFTYHDMAKEKGRLDTYQTQAIAYSNDNGRTWKKYNSNPVIANPGIRDFRDPKVIWNEKAQKWILVLAAYDHVKFYASDDLKNWNHLSDFGQDLGSHGGLWECPDLFPMTIEGTQQTKWVLLVSINPGGPNHGSATQYFVGNFDGKSFEVDPVFEKKLGLVEAQIPPGRVFEDFESISYDLWQKNGFAMGNGPVKGAAKGQQPVKGFTGEYLVNSFFGADETTGTLTSPSFIIQNSSINFQIGGGNHPGETCLNLVIEDEVVASQTGSNSERLEWRSFDVSKWKGKQAKLVLVDSSSEGWGHILLDQVMFADAPAISTFEKAVWMDYGRDNYAGVTWSDIPEEDGRRLFLGWMSNWDYAQVVPTQKWRSAMTIPRALSLVRTNNGLKLTTRPVKELESLRKEPVPISSMDLKGEQKLETDESAIELIVEYEVNDEKTTEFGIRISNDLNEFVEVGVNLPDRNYFIDRRKSGKTDFSKLFVTTRDEAPIDHSAKKFKMHLFIDVSSVELFADDGRTVMTEIFFPNEDYQNVVLYSKGGSVKILSGTIYPLQ